MQCLSPISITNPKYKEEPFRPYIISSDGEILGEKIDDTKLLVPCGKCVNCLKNKRNSLTFRLSQETYSSKSAYFLTLTVSDQYMPLFKSDPKSVFRKWFENIRYRYGHSPRHFIISELGSITKRLHFHGIIWNPPFSEKELSILWPYGFSYVGYVNNQTINYISKYITKPQLDDDNYKPFSLQSNRPGIGFSWLTPENISHYRNTSDFTVTCNKSRITLPRYYFNKIFTEKERRDKIKDYNDSLLNNPFSYLFRVLLKNKCKDINEYLLKVQIHYRRSLELGLSKPKFKQNGTFKSNYDSSTTERVEF